MSADYEAIIRAAVDRLPPDDAEGRNRLYERARVVVREKASLASAERQAALDRVEAAIARIETALSRPAPLAAAARGGRRWVGWLAAALVACAVAVPVLLYATRATGPRVQGPVISDFAGPDSGFEQVNGKPIAQITGKEFQFTQSDGRSVLRVEGRAQLISTARYRVDPAKLYRMEVGLRSLVLGQSQASRVNAGVATYDADGKLQTAAPGTHRYFAMQEALPAAEGWQVRSGFITGEGNTTHSTFRPGTRYVRPIILVNYGSREQAVEVDFVRFDECTSPTDCRTMKPLTEPQADRQ
ncbi:MAG: hypothetical protein AB7O39_08860 [Flavobacteriaceae bacterium]